MKSLRDSLNEAIKHQDVIIATDDNIHQIVEDEIDRLGDKADLNHIDVSKVTNMSGVFENLKFNGDISKWDVSNVKTMEAMFRKSSFNGDISKWDVSNVKDMSRMFKQSTFNGDISKWDISKVDNIELMLIDNKLSDKNKEKLIKTWGDDVCMKVGIL